STSAIRFLKPRPTRQIANKVHESSSRHAVIRRECAKRTRRGGGNAALASRCQVVAKLPLIELQKLDAELHACPQRNTLLCQQRIGSPVSRDTSTRAIPVF